MWPPETLPRALLVDLDGTLADSHGVLRSCFERFLGARHIDATDDLFEAFDGVPLAEISESLRTRFGLTGDPDALRLEYERGVEDGYATVGPARGVDALVGFAVHHGVSLVLVTSAPRHLAEAFLKGAGIRADFDAVVSGEDGKAKPDPALFLRGLEAAGVVPSAALAVDDAPAGIRAARSAGVQVVGVAADPKRATSLREAGAEAVVSDVGELAAVLEALSPGRV